METAPGEQKRLWVKGVGAEGSGSCETRENGVHSGSPAQFSGSRPLASEAIERSSVGRAV
jgi:hypothetical protein